MRVSFGDVTGREWDQFCQKLLRRRHSDYQEVPAQFGGDLGIEGFTRSGIVFQCYCPDENLTGTELYEKQRDKITEDIGKLLRNATDISALGAGIIREWHFVTPRINDRAIHGHCRTKEVLVRSRALPQVSTDFQIFVKTEDDYIPERQAIITTGLNRICSSGEEPDQADIDACLASGNPLVCNIDGKIRKLRQPSDASQRARLVQRLVRDLVIGRQELERLNQRFPDVFRSVSQLKAAKEAQLETAALTNTGDAGALLKDSLQRYEQALKDGFSMQMDSALISRLASEAISDWLGRCPLDFPETQERLGNAN